MISKKFLPLLLLSAISVSTMAGTRGNEREIKLKTLELRNAIAHEEMIKSIAEDAANRSHLSKAFGYGAIGISAPAVVFRSSLLIIDVLQIGWSQAHIPVLMTDLAIISAAVGGSEIKATKELFKALKKENPEFAEEFNDIKILVDDRLDPSLASQNIKEARKILDKLIEDIYANELDGSFMHDVQDRITFGSLAADATQKLYIYNQAKRMLVERELKLLEQ